MRKAVSYIILLAIITLLICWAVFGPETPGRWAREMTIGLLLAEPFPSREAISGFLD